MSINVTVKGNPVSIKHGKMVTADPNYEKKEFEKRRLMRLEQVRQQSKEIAEEVRKKVRKEKEKQMGEIEKEGKEKIKNWQNRKLLELQSQYKEALEELGVGHKAAEKFINESMLLDEQRDRNKSIAENRGKTAATKLQVQKNQESFKKAVPIQRKKIVRDIENTRASIVSNLKKKKSHGHTKKKSKKRKTSADINITIPNDSDESISESQSSEDSRTMHIINEEQTAPPASSQQSSDEVKEVVDTATDAASSRKTSSVTKLNYEGSEKTASATRSNSASLGLNTKNYSQIIKEQQELIENFRKNQLQIPMDTRISDRIKQREILASQPDYCDLDPELLPATNLDFNTRLKSDIGSRYVHNFMNVDDSSDSDRCFCCKMKSCCKRKRDPVRNFNEDVNNLNGNSRNIQKGFNTQHDDAKDVDREAPVASDVQSAKQKTRMQSSANVEIPFKPPVRLIPNHVSESARHQSEKIARSGSDTEKVRSVDIPDTRTTFDSKKVPYYDHRNRFHTQRNVPATYAEKITTDSLEVLPNIVSETEWRDKMRQRDREAQIRGKRALEKERIQKDYQEILQKLPVLQKKERIQEMYKDKPEYHMTDERLKELERKRQNALENAYTQAMPSLKPAIVTLPSKKTAAPAPTDRFKDIETTDSKDLNVANWDVDHDTAKLFSAEEVQDIIKVFTGQKPQDRQAKLKELLKSLKLQKDELINEIKMLPKDDSIPALLTDLNSFTDLEENKRLPGKTDNKDRKRRREENENLSVSESSTSSEIKSKEKGKEKRRRRKKHSKTPPTKKPRESKQRILVLQNTSTQTTPKTVKPSLKPITDDEKSSEIDKPESQSKPVTICHKIHTPCSCNEDKNKELSSDELCRIFIKLNENDDPEVIVKTSKDQTAKSADEEQQKVIKEVPSKIKTKSVAVMTEGELKENIPPESKVSQKSRTPSEKALPHKTRSDKKRESKTTVTSWREQLSKNSNSTSSTSYFSPPDFSKKPPPKRRGRDLKNKPQQENIDCMSIASSNQSSQIDKTIDPNLLGYIRKLLSSSRISIDELGVSSSDIQTPSQSIIEMESNNPLALLHNIVREFNLHVDDIVEQLSASSTASHVPDNSPASCGTDKSTESEKKKVAFSDRDTPTSSEQIKQSVLLHYKKITDTCDERIANIAAMIEQLKEEKIRLAEKLHQQTSNNSSHSDKAFSSTAYMDLPQKSDKSSTSSSFDEEEITKKILEIDMDLAQKLRIFGTPRDEADAPVPEVKSVGVQKSQKRVQIVEGAYQPDKQDQDFLKRLERLLQNSPRALSPQPTEPPPSSAQETNDVPFVSFLCNIPKLPKFDSGPESTSSSKDSNNHKHPPPSKGLSIAKKFNGNISLVPHELSTIVEADSQLSARISSAQISPTVPKEVVDSPVKSSKASRIKSTVVAAPINTAETSTKTTVDGLPIKSFITRFDMSPPKLVPTGLDCEPVKSVAKTKANIQTGIENRQKSPRNVRTVPTRDTSKRVVSPTVTSTCGISHVSFSDCRRPGNDSTCSRTKSLSFNSSKNTATSSSSSSEQLDSIEDMLRAIGMEWAIPTLKKTQEALALTSSSSSLSLNLKSKSNSSHNSEISLKEFLQKELSTKISSSTFKSDVSPGSALEFSELSAIQANNCSDSEKNRRKTSTPVLDANKSSSKNKPLVKQAAIFTAESDISSVKFTTLSGSNSSSSRSSR